MWLIRVRQDARDGSHQLSLEDSGLTIHRDVEALGGNAGGRSIQISNIMAVDRLSKIRQVAGERLPILWAISGLRSPIPRIHIIALPTCKVETQIEIVSKISTFQVE
jgi:hypothetical protein